MTRPWSAATRASSTAFRGCASSAGERARHSQECFGRIKRARASVDPPAGGTTMLRLVLGLLFSCVLLYGAYRGLRPGAPPPAAQQAAARREGVTLPASGPAA